MLNNVEFFPLHDEAVRHEEESERYVLKISLRGSLSIDNASEVTILLRTLVKGGIREIMMNMEHITYIDSTGIGTIIGMKKNIASESGDAVLLNVPPKIAEILDLINISAYIKTFYSDEKAMEYFASQAGLR